MVGGTLLSLWAEHLQVLVGLMSQSQQSNPTQENMEQYHAANPFLREALGSGRRLFKALSALVVDPWTTVSLGIWLPHPSV
jgi:hypothetical protein